jgi:hypothetical protein
MMDVKT